MKIRNTKRYICEYCSMGFWKPDVCITHESGCSKNPESKSYWNCKYFSNEQGEPWWCIKFEKDLVSGVIIEGKNARRLRNGNCKEFKIKD